MKRTIQIKSIAHAVSNNGVKMVSHEFSR